MSAQVSSSHPPFAPFDPAGALPPGVTAEHVALAYRSMDLRPKLVLYSLDIKSFTGLPATRLRRALDNPAARRERTGGHHERQRPSFHDSLYNAMRERSVESDGVYATIVLPSEKSENDRTFLDAAAFATHVAAAANLDAATIEPDSREETLALFALAFALLQPEDAAAILEPVMAKSAALRGFFGGA